MGANSRVFEDLRYVDGLLAFNRFLSNFDINFTLQLYPDNKHGIVGNGSRDHLFQMLTDYLESSLTLTSLE